MLPPRPTRTIRIGSLLLGGDHPIAVQSMAATVTRDEVATARQIELLTEAGADIIRIAIDSKRDAECLERLAQTTEVPLSVDLQENYRLAEIVAPYVQKIRYNPGHLHHHDKELSAEEKVRWIAKVATAHHCAIRIGVNAGSIAPEYDAAHPEDHVAAIVACAVDHCKMLDNAGFHDFLVSIKDSDPRLVIEANTRFAKLRPDVPLHLGVTEAGLPPDGVIKTRVALEQLISAGIGDTLRVSLTVPFESKGDEIQVGRSILNDIAAGRFRSVPKGFFDGLNIIACPSCSRVENNRFVELAQEVKELTTYAKDRNVTIAVMGCRVNGPGETDDADLGLWCGPTTVNLKRGPKTVGSYSYDDILPALHAELDLILAAH